MKKYCLLLCMLCAPVFLCAQSNRRFADTLLSVHIDSVIEVTAKRGLDMTDFVRVMINDTMFYQAFRNLQKFSFTAENKIVTYDTKNRRLSTIYRRIAHRNTGASYKQEILQAQDSGKVYSRKGTYDLYTVRMFSYIFMNDRNTDFTETKAGKKELDEEGYKQKLKTLIFNPGKPVHGIPFISSKTEIFGPELRKYYDYTFYHAMYQDSIPIYYFKCKMKPGLSASRQDDIMIKELTTIFDARNFNILGRFIDMKYESLPFDFDVKMNIELAYRDDMLVPVVINYDGSWDIPFKKAEVCTFDIKHGNFIPAPGK